VHSASHQHSSIPEVHLADNQDSSDVLDALKDMAPLEGGYYLKHPILNGMSDNHYM
jgi:hypothetical protein